MEIDQPPKSQKNKYEYYINYAGFQRRNDKWVTEEEIRLDEEEITREKKKFEERLEEEKENVEFLFNDEHLGLNEK